jgi:hypothetical protein
MSTTMNDMKEALRELGWDDDLIDALVRAPGFEIPHVYSAVESRIPLTTDSANIELPSGQPAIFSGSTERKKD